MPLQRQFIYTKKTMSYIAVINNSDIGSEEYNSNKLLNVLIVRAGFPSSQHLKFVVKRFSLIPLIMESPATKIVF